MKALDLFCVWRIPLSVALFAGCATVRVEPTGAIETRAVIKGELSIVNIPCVQGSTERCGTFVTTKSDLNLSGIVESLAKLVEAIGGIPSGGLLGDILREGLPGPREGEGYAPATSPETDPEDTSPPEKATATSPWDGP